MTIMVIVQREKKGQRNKMAKSKKRSRSGNIGPGMRRLSIVLTNQIVERLDAIAAHRKTNRSQVCREILENNAQNEEIMSLMISDPGIKNAIFSSFTGKAAQAVLKKVKQGKAADASDLEAFSGEVAKKMEDVGK